MTGFGEPEKPDERPLLEWVLKAYPQTPKTRAKQWIIARRVSVKGVIISKPHQLLTDPGDTLQLGGRSAASVDFGDGWQIHPRVSLLHLDTALAIVNKGAGLLSVPAPNGEISALSILSDYLTGSLRPRDRRIAGKTLPPAWRRLEPLPVHRLDQYTTGVFCMATSPSARQHLIEQVKNHTMKREYVAFVEGRSRVAKGTWRQWLELSRDEMRQTIVPEAQARRPDSQAQEAVTHFEVVQEYQLAGTKGVVTQLRLRLETGRKHQIRVQAAHAGLPLIGDRKYNPGYSVEGRTFSPIDFPRQALHAELIELEHPIRPGVRLTWRAPCPKDMRQLEDFLKASRMR